MKRHNYSDWLSVALIELRAVSWVLMQERQEEDDIRDLKCKADDDYYAGDCFNREKPARTIWRRAHLIQARARCTAKFYAQRELIRQLHGIQRLLEYDIEAAITKHYTRIARWDGMQRDRERLAAALRGDFLPPPPREIPWIHKFTAVLDLHA